ncbi:MAG TPA: NAD(P)/FAD-dependent oxidoreductase [Egibacteraceae bacterium]|nr:NAD(P)/FAD-dependent oxidoreductase [Egibacteraceae bacterium]
MPDHYDAIIVGGRLAGASTAMLLARAGLRVLVAERARYGSDTLSTHALMRAGVIQLSRWGLLNEIDAAGTPAVRTTTIRYGDTEAIIDIKPMPHCPALYAPKRRLLDRVLADAAVRAGADVRFRTRVNHLLRDADGAVIGAEIDDRDGGQRDVFAPITIGADGSRSLVASTVGAPVYAEGAHATAFIVGYWSGVEAEGYQWLYADGGAAGVIPTNDGQLCVWTGIPHTEFPDVRALPDHGFRAGLARVAPDWLARLDAGAQHGPLRAFPGMPGYLRQPAGPGWALVGDAGYFKDPITAHGMTDALRDAELLAGAVVDGLGGAADLPTAMARYRDTRDRLSREVFELGDRVSAYDWDMNDLRELLVAMSEGMRGEVAHLGALEPLADQTRALLDA